MFHDVVACAGGCNKVRDGGKREKWMCEDCSDDYELIECSECGKEKPVEKGTWALDKGMCESCYCKYQGG